MPVIPKQILRLFTLRSCWCVVVLLTLGLLACYDAQRSNPFDPELTPAVELLDVKVDEKEGTATLVWTRYAGTMEFGEYRVHRRVAEMVSVDTVAFIPSVSDTFFVDDTIAPDTEYIYQVVVRNKEGFEIGSNEYRSGSFSLHGVRLESVEVNDRRGEAHLVWSRFVGPGFESYVVRRRIGGTLEVEERRIIPLVDDTTFTDSNLFADVEYEYTVGVRVFGKELESNEWGVEYRLPAVELRGVDFDSRTASALLEWTRYDGPHFKSYEVLRRTEELASRSVFEEEDISTTSFVDSSGLDGNTEYFYTVVVRDSIGSQSQSNEVSGIFHKWVDWRVVGAPPWGIVIDKNDNVYTCRTVGGGVSIVSFDLSLRERFSTDPIGSLLEGGKVDLTTDGEGNVYVAFDQDEGGVRVCKVNSVGDSLWMQDIEMKGSRLAGIGVMGDNEILVANIDSDVFVFDPNGQELRSFRLELNISAIEVWEDILGAAVPGTGSIGTFRLSKSSGRKWLGWIGRGVGAEGGQLLHPLNMVRGDSDRLFVVNGGLGRIEVFKGGEYLTKFGRIGRGPGEFIFEKEGVFHGGVALDSEENVYVADPGNHRIHKFEP